LVYEFTLSWEYLPFNSKYDGVLSIDGCAIKLGNSKTHTQTSNALILLNGGDPGFQIKGAYAVVFQLF
jgi:hypothetical protein